MGSGLGKRALLVSVVGISFFIFVAGSFVFPYLSLSAAANHTARPSGSILALPAKEPGNPFSLALPFPTSEATRTTPPTPSPAGPPEPVATPGRINILLLGIDQRNDEKGVPTRTDTMMVVSVDQATKTGAMISLPRDMWVEIPGYADNRINVANFLGDAERAGNGPILAKKTVERNFGLKIDYFARIDFRGFEKIVDTLGGVDIDVERAIYDAEYPTEDYETMSIYIPAGPQHMNGRVALQYARSRHSENDFGRAKRQQRLLLAIRDRALQLDVIPKLPSLMGTLMAMVLTDIPPTEFLRLAALAREVDPARVSNLVIDDKLARPFKGEGGADLLMPNKPAIRAAIVALFAEAALKKEGARIEVVNAAGKAGLATRTSELLSQQGFYVAKVSSADGTNQRITQILAAEDKKATTTALCTLLKLSPQAVVWRPAASSPDERPDIQVVLGQDFALP